MKLEKYTFCKTSVFKRTEPILLKQFLELIKGKKCVHECTKIVSTKLHYTVIMI